ncbi:Coenzyme PQQ biosynthesis protein PqqF [Pseudomonas cichorii]|uniref:Coenzyme PQQ synthesis protein F n=1 Tax=Pseudomonas cichorii TaxID=36746 RepID=A0A3M4LPJ4_PSECI|nr:pyrroloquinoline quinone biosynthesis protein PqqF [Pseudomonas cichorii]RMQ42941.1 Coenzyme PQQ biosynthesis protein PqqF [Pseudomonas cichorii]
MPDTQRLTLPNGLNVVLCHAPRLKRCAASLRVAAGSHDVPQAWPGLAHFLEHLFFLGTERFAAGENLMAFVQRHGGQINASTRERTTDFFFELPPRAFAQGLERLCDMLAHPRLALPDQFREREVLHAEFIAWTQDAKAREQIRLLAPINSQHPLRAFHAGNRYSLAVPNPAFQQALQGFYQRFYQAGQMTLCLSGPQPLAELQALAAEHGSAFNSAGKVTQQAPVALLDTQQVRHTAFESTGRHLLFACEGLPAKAEEAVAFFCHWLMDAQPGGLVAELLEQGLIDSLTASPLYQFDGQLLLDIDCAGTKPATSVSIAALFFDWLAFFKNQWSALVEEYRRLQQRRLQACGALEMAHHFCRDTPADLGERGALALSVLLDQLSPETLVPPLPVDKLACGQVEWRLPAANPFLQPVAVCEQAVASPMIYSEALPCDNGEGAIFLRWQLPSAQPEVWRMLNGGLHNLGEQARQAGVAVSFSAYGNYWQLRLTGLHEPMAAILERALDLLQHPGSKTLARQGQADDQPALMPIRQLLKVLPDHFLSSEPGQRIDDLQALWRSSRWTGLVTGLPSQSRSRLNSVLQAMPGLAEQQALAAPSTRPGKRWQTQTCGSPEDAVLLFCTTPDSSVAHEAGWRLLAHLIQAPFYQRLRVELQLGYAVFSGLRQIAGRSGLLFGVQSPASSAEQLVGHIETFIDELPELIQSADLPGLRQTLAEQFDQAAMPNEQAAELLWQACLYGQAGNPFEQLPQTLLHLEKHSLLAVADQLKAAKGGWLILANRPVPAAWTGNSAL